MQYDVTDLPRFVQDAKRQRAKEIQFVERLIPCFNPGSVLDIGTGCGQIAQLLQDRGIDIVASDYFDFFIDYQKSLGLNSIKVDATDILHSAGRRFDNILTQGVTTLVSSDLQMAEATYASVWEALVPGGRFVFVFPDAYHGKAARHAQDPNKEWSTLEEHWPLISNAGYSVVKHFRNQIMRSNWYNVLPRPVSVAIESTIGKQFGRRNVLVLEKPVTAELRQAA